MSKEFPTNKYLNALLRVVIKEAGLDSNKIQEEVEVNLRLDDLMAQKNLAIQAALTEMGLDECSVNILSGDDLTEFRKDLIQKNHWGKFIKIVTTELGSYVVIDKKFHITQTEQSSDLRFILTGKYSY